MTVTAAPVRTDTQCLLCDDYQGGVCGRAPDNTLDNTPRQKYERHHGHECPAFGWKPEGLMAEREQARSKYRNNPEGLGGTTHKRKEKPMQEIPTTNGEAQRIFTRQHKDEILNNFKQMGAIATAKKWGIPTWRVYDLQRKPRTTKKTAAGENKHKPALTFKKESVKGTPSIAGLQPPGKMSVLERQAWNKAHEPELVELVKTTPYRELVGKWGMAGSTISRCKRMAGILPAVRQKPGKGSQIVNLPAFPKFEDLGFESSVKVAWLQAYAQMATGGKGK